MDITPQMMNCRECARGVWNTCFRVIGEDWYALSTDQAASITPRPGGLDESFQTGVDEVQAVLRNRHDDANLQPIGELP